MRSVKSREKQLPKSTLIYAITLCICALALLVASARIQLTENRMRIAESPSSEMIPEEPKPMPVAAAVTPKPTKEPHEEPLPSETPAPTEMPVVPLDQMTLLLPTQGEVDKNFSGDSLVKSATMRDWRVHNGIDITAEIGTEVVAAADGVVSDLYFDDLMGITVRIDHKNGAETLYQNLSGETRVEVGQMIKKGDLISGVGDTSSCEIKDSPHLHFVLLVDGKAVDPMDYVKTK